MWAQDMLKRHKAFAVSVPLGAYGASSEKPGCIYASNNNEHISLHEECMCLYMQPASFHHESNPGKG